MVQTGGVMPRVVAVVGPTGVGKTRLSLAIAARFGGEIISGDAFQFYRGLDIGTAKTKPEERRGIPHHLIDILPPEAPFSVADYQRVVRAKIAELHDRGTLAILVGGSGLYVQAVLNDYRFAGAGRDRTPDPFLAALGNAELLEILRAFDAELPETVDPNNRRRLLRLLDIARSANAEERALKTADVPFYPDAVVIGLAMPRDALIRQIDARVAEMMAAGLEAEVRGLYDRGIRGQSLSAIGYKEFFPYFEGRTTLAAVVETIRIHSRQYAKRQMTWFRNRMDATWFPVDPERFETTVDAVLGYLENHLKA